MTLELVSHKLCPFVHRAAIMLREKGVSFSRRTIDLENKPDWFLAISPRGKVPVLVVDGVPLFESAAICEFLDETHPPQVIPADPFERARQRAWVEVANDLLLAQYKLFSAAEEDEADKARAVLEPVLQRFETAVAGGALPVDGFGLIHVAVAPALHRFVVIAEQLGVEFLTATPRLAGLARALADRPSVIETVPADFAEAFLLSLVERNSRLVATSGRADPVAAFV